MTGSVLIAGASGRFGSNAAKAFEAAGWTVRHYRRLEETLLEAAKGMDVIVNALNPQNYKNWEAEIPRITQEVLKAATAHGATVLVPGNVYNFGVQQGPWSETTPQRPNTIKGRVRVEMEEAYRASGVQTIILRSGDFIDAGATGTWLDLVCYKGLAKGKFTYPGNPDIAHSWGYLRDLGRAGVALVERREALETFTDVSFEGFTVTGQEIANTLGHLLGREIKLAKMPWWPIRLASPFWGLGRELLEMRYLWDHPHGLSGARFAALVPDFETTSLRDALAASLPVDVHPKETVIRAETFA